LGGAIVCVWVVGCYWGWGCETMGCVAGACVGHLVYAAGAVVIVWLDMVIWLVLIIALMLVVTLVLVIRLAVVWVYGTDGRGQARRARTVWILCRRISSIGSWGAASIGILSSGKCSCGTGGSTTIWIHSSGGARRAPIVRVDGCCCCGGSHTRRAPAIGILGRS